MNYDRDGKLNSPYILVDTVPKSTDAIPKHTLVDLGDRWWFVGPTRSIIFAASTRDIPAPIRWYYATTT